MRSEYHNEQQLGPQISRLCAAWGPILFGTGQIYGARNLEENVRQRHEEANFAPGGPARAGGDDEQKYELSDY
eukprot:scaffold90243_cov17-Prasinocladus_malaysianus.AAC.1